MPDISDGSGLFENAGALREAHTVLLEALDRELGGDTSEAGEAAAVSRLESRIRQFLERGAATGAYIEETNERTDCQLLLNFWLSSLSQAGLRGAGARLAKFDSEGLPDLKDKSCPYVGLEAFQGETFFFGREADTKALTTQVLNEPLVIVAGVSGSGKSSLVMGGVLPALMKTRNPAYRIIPPIVPGNAVLAHLIRAICVSSGCSGSDIALAVTHLRQDRKHLLALLGGDEAPPTVITIDQFEEVFTLSDRTDRDTLVESLAYLLDTDSDHRVILTMREEFKSKIVALKAFDPYRDQAWYSMRPMGYAELRAAVERPASLVNLQFQQGIVDDLVKKVLGQPAALPLLQFTLSKLWENRDRNRITWEVYRKLGENPLTSLKNTADHFYDNLAQQTQDEVKRILLELVRVDELLEAYRQPVAKTTLLKAGKANTEEVIGLLAANDYIRVTSNGSETEIMVEVKHESLVRNWPRYVSWIDEKRHKWRQRIALSQTAKRWVESGKPSAGLLTYWQLQGVKQLPDLDSREKEFIEASEKAINRRERRKMRMLVSGFTFLLLIVGSIWMYDHFIRQEKKRTWDVLENLKQIESFRESTRYVENELNEVARYLWKKSSDDKRDPLHKLLKILHEADEQGLFQANKYQVSEWNAWESAEKIMSRKRQAKAAVEILSNNEFNESMVRLAWREFLTYSRERGVPLPDTVNVIHGSDESSSILLKIRKLQYQVAEADTKTTSVKQLKPTRIVDEVEPKTTKSGYLIANEIVSKISFDYDSSKILLKVDPGIESNQHIGALTQKLLLHEEENLVPAEKAFTGPDKAQWWWVPRWTIPLWRAVGNNRLYPPEAALAQHVITILEERPKLLLSDGLVLEALGKEIENTPNLVESACKESGGIEVLSKQIQDKLTDWASMQKMVYLLESLAKPGLAPQLTDSQNRCDMKNINRFWPDSRESDGTGRSRESRFLAWQMKRAIVETYKPLAPLRVSIAGNLEQYIAPDGKNSDAQVERRLRHLLGGFSREFGITLPRVRFEVKPQLNSNEIEIEIGREDSIRPIWVRTGHELDDMMEELKVRLFRTRPAWVSVEEVIRLADQLPYEVKEWLLRKYSPAELKVILREVLVNEGSKYDDWSPVETKDVHGESGATLTHLPWLIRSLAFWSQVCKNDDYMCLGQGLRKIQKARMALKQDDQSLPVLPEELLPLEGERFKEVEEGLAQWLEGYNRQTAEEVFLQAYGKTWARMEYDRILPACSPEPGRFEGHERLVRARSEELSGLLRGSEGILTESQHRVLELCLYSSHTLDAQDFPELSQSLDEKLGEAIQKPAAWSPKEKYWLSYLAIKTHLTSPEAEKRPVPTHLAKIQGLLFAAVQELPLATAEGAYAEVLGLCSNPGAGGWCMEMLTKVADARLESCSIPGYLAFSCYSINRHYAQLALQLLERAEKNLDRVGTERERQEKAWLNYTRGLAYQTLADLGDGGALDQAIGFFEEATADGFVEGGPGTDAVYGALAGAFMRKGEIDKAGEVIEHGLQDTSGTDQTQLRGEKYRLYLSRGELEEAIALTEGRPGEGDRFLRCLVRMIAGNQNNRETIENDVTEFLDTSHDYTDYIRLIFYWKLMRDGESGQAKEILEKRWDEIKPSKWEDFLLDPSATMRVWREKLIGYYLGKVSEAEISNVIQDPKLFQASPFNNAEQSREGFLCEWYFYDGLWQSVNDDPATRGSRLSERLTKAVATNQLVFLENIIARDMLKRMDAGEVFTLQELKN